MLGSEWNLRLASQLDDNWSSWWSPLCWRGNVESFYPFPREAVTRGSSMTWDENRGINVEDPKETKHRSTKEIYGWNMRSDIKERRYECKDNVTWELEDWLCQTIRIASRILITIPLILTRFDQRLSTRDRKKVHKYEVPFVGSWVLQTCANTSRRRCYGSKQNTITKKSFHVHESNVPRLWETRETRWFAVD